MSVSMYFAVSWLEPRLQINESASEWFEDRTGPKNVSTFRSIYLSNYKTIYFIIYPPSYLSIEIIDPAIYLYIFPTFYVFNYLSIQLSIY